MSFHKRTLFLALLFTCAGLGCKKFIDVDGPVTSTSGANVYTNDATAAAVLTGIYTRMSTNSMLSSAGLPTISILNGLSADEFRLWEGVSNPVLIAYYTNNLSPTEFGSEYWSFFDIFTCNSAIKGLSESTQLTAEVKTQLLGEAKFMRAFFNFYLVNMFGDIPLVLSTEYNTNSILPRTSRDSIYEHIVEDLLEAKKTLSSDYLHSDARSTTNERVRPNKWVAGALLARVYLYMGEYEKAEMEASTIIENVGMYSLVSSMTDVFLANSNEAIWQLQPVNSNITEDAISFIIPASGFSDDSYPVYLDNGLINSFHQDDLRKSNWIGKYTDTASEPDVEYHYAYKYKENVPDAPSIEYLTVLRLAEQYLIRSEARLEQKKLSDALTDLNELRSRAGLQDTTLSDVASIRNALLQERRHELFSEWGHRWFDLKRTGNLDAVMMSVAPSKGGEWSNYKSLFPLPQSEIDRDQNLVQNPGY